ncbi:MAG TPA: pentapeptide repeat-containing protein, partial [Acidimicrobiales bacterium]|nr:pentapeptide repeat-containing protein [Acidimicrobiales bacterium]
ARLLDGTVVSNERDYAAGTFAGDSDVEADALGEGYYFSDDPFVASPSSTVGVGGEELYLPTAAVGRLIESASDIEGTISRFLENGNDINADTGLTTGYSFLDSASELISSNLAASDVGVSQLLGSSWDVSDLEQALDPADVAAGGTPSGPGVDSLNAHFDYYGALTGAGEAADSTNPDYVFYPSDVSSDVNPTTGQSAYVGRLLFSMGCHAGLDIDAAETDYLTGGSSVAEWASTFAEAGALWVANTGYGYGDTNQVAYSAALMANFAGDVTQQLDVGQALAEAVQQYDADNALLSPYDIKSMMESTLYGLPMYQLSTPSGEQSGAGPLQGQLRVSPGSGAATTARAQAKALPAQSSSPITLGSMGTNAATGLPEVPVTASMPAATSASTAVGGDLVPESGTGAGGASSYYELDTGSALGNTQTTEFRPIEPLATADVTEPGYVAHGELIDGLSSTDIDAGSFDPTISDPDDDTSVTPPPIGTAAFPGALQRVANSETFTSAEASPSQQLDLVAGQFIPNPATPGSGTQRLFTGIEGDVLYTPASSSDALDFTPPTIISSSGQVVGSSADFDVTVTAGEAAVPVDAVEVLYTDAENPGTWTALSLQGSGGTWTGSGSAPASGELSYFVEAVDAAGNVAVSNNNGSFFGATSTPPIGITLVGTQSSGAYTSPVSAEVSVQPGASTDVSYTLEQGSSSTSGPLPSGGTIDVDSSGSYTLTVTTTDPLDVSSSNQAGAVSDSVSFTITLPAPVLIPTPTSTSLTSSTNPSAFGQKVSFTAKVSPQPDAGSVELYDGTTAIGTVTLSNGEAVLSSSTLPAGRDAISATYSEAAGDDDFTSSTSAVLTQVVESPTTTTTLTSSEDPSVVGQSVTYAAAVSDLPPAVGTPSGTVAFSDGGVTIKGCTAVTLSAGKATCTTSYSSTGDNSITAVYSGGGTLNGSLTQYVDTSLSSYKSLSGINLSGAYLVMANLSHDNLSGDNLSGANLTGANLAGTNLQGDNLETADLAGADLAGATLQGDNLSGADLAGADAVGANLQGDNLSDANGAGADFVSAELQGDNLSGGDLAYADFQGDNLSGSNLESANLTGANLSSANLSGSNLESANLTGANLSGDNLQGANLEDTKLTDANLSDSNLSGANVESANLTGANLAGTNLQGTNLESDVLTNASLDAAKTSGANLDKITWSNTICPDGTNSNNDKDTCANDLKT